MPVSDFADLLQSTITHEPFSSRDQYGVVTYGTAVSYKARVSYTNKRVRSRVTGDDVISTAQAWINGNPTLNVDDRITLPDGSQPIIVSWDQPFDETGSAHHVKIYFRG
jgi:hypothetical protein